MKVQQITLTGKIIRLEPMKLEHVEALSLVGVAPELWHLQPAPISSQEEMHLYVAKALNQFQAGEALPFVIVSIADEKIIGTTRYMDISPQNRRLEIGATWLSPSHQRTGANTETKSLLLTYAFESLGVQRIVFKTEVLNEKSRNALLRLGAIEEGTFRKHLIATSGRARDMVYFSILDHEWPQIKERLKMLTDKYLPRPE
ncbi:GNAT family N-acetyltransferase [Marinomonas spartinae]|uniref:GNAT family N-acetyltransferase n=1 Tax=Marinomonas spartinae TaxID=1792290 RepID=UPI0018F2185A|nr:GNAT family protein [Marinomonas spartinae]MBJ7553770.1 GNAT family N-acetyltransferase [Marinomonas spartinae]